MTAAPASRPAPSAVESHPQPTVVPQVPQVPPVPPVLPVPPVPPQPAATPGRAFALIVGASIAVLTAVCGVFLILDVSVPSWALVIGRWIPAFVALVVLLRMPVLHGTGWGTLASWWGLRRRRGAEDRPRFIGTVVASAGAAAGVIVIAVVTAALAATVGAIELQATGVLVMGVLAMLPLTLVFAVSTLGEEVVWRSHLPRLVDGGFWPSACLIAAAWTAFHVPLHLTYVLQGDMPASHATALTLGLLPLSLFLSAAAARWGNVWPAVIAHAVPFSALTLATDAPALDAAGVWTVTGISAALFLSASMAIAPVQGDGGGGAHRGIRR